MGQQLESKHTPRRTRTSGRWVVFLILALLVSFWSALAALFFLVVLGLILHNPSSDLSSAVGKSEQRSAQRIYTWLFVSSIFTVPMLIIIVAATYSNTETTNQHVLHALLPLFFHLPLLLGLASGSRFVYRHTQQGILLSALRAGLAAVSLNIGNYPEDGIALFLFGNGLLWFFGSLWGWLQVNRAECWWMKLRGEHVLPHNAEFEAMSAQRHIQRSREFVNHFDARNAKKHALAAFRKGDAEIRQQAVKLLDAQGEVETF